MTVVECWPTMNLSSRAFATMARTLEVLDSRGLAEDLLSLGQHAEEVRIFGGAGRVPWWERAPSGYRWPKAP